MSEPGSRASSVALSLLVLLVPASPGTSGAEEVFVDRAADWGLDFVHFNGMSGELYFAEMMGAGAGFVDYDGDGDLDVYLVQGTMLGKEKTIEDALFTPRHPLPLSDRLYRNDLEIGPDGDRTVRFTDVTEASGIGALAHGYGMGVATGDFDGDGAPDLYLTNLGANQLLRNEGDGTFSDVTSDTGTGDPLWGVPAVFFDPDRDGDLDLFVGNYVDWRLATHKPCTSPAGALDYCSPSAFEPEPDRLFRNLGTGRFEDATESSGVHREPGAALGAVAEDFDGDGWLDLYVANDGMANRLWINREDGTFENDALLAGTAVNEEGQPEASMGVVTGDFDVDGDEDLFMTHLDRETNTLYVNDGSGFFEDRSRESGLAASSWRVTGFGVAVFDYDHDGWQDLYVANGAVTLIWEQVREGEKLPLAQPNQLYRGLGGGRFEEVTDRAGSVFRLSEVSRGVAVGDVDGDGDEDLLVSNNAGPARLLVNEVGRDQGWLGVRLQGGETGRDLVGARIRLRPGPHGTLRRRVRTDGSYASARDPRVLFGVGEDVSPKALEIEWPDGRSTRLASPVPGVYLVVRKTIVEPLGG